MGLYFFSNIKAKSKDYSGYYLKESAAKYCPGKSLPFSEDETRRMVCREMPDKFTAAEMNNKMPEKGRQFIRGGGVNKLEKEGLVSSSKPGKEVVWRNRKRDDLSWKIKQKKMKSFFANIFKMDWILFFPAVFLMASGLLAIYSLSISSPEEGISNFQKQLIFLVIGLGIFLFFSLVDYRLWKSYAYFLYGLGIISLVLVLWFGTTIRGTSGWFDLGFFNFQPVEAIKVFLIFALAAYLSKFKNKKIRWKGVLVSFLLMATPFLLVLKQPDFGSASVLAVIWIAMLFLAGVDKKIIAFLLISGTVFFALGWVSFFQDYQKERIQTFLSPGGDPLDKGYNVIQSMVAIGSGGLTGKGIGHGSQSQLNFLPEKHTDFVFAAVGEESGFLGAFLVLLSFWVLFFRLIKISIEAGDCFGRLLTVGILALFSYQVLVNIGMNLGIVPVAGISLPFLSYGGSFLFVSFALLGLSMSIWRKRKTGGGLFNEPDLI